MDEKERERAYRYDLFVAPDWTERFDELVGKFVKPPTKGRLLEVNCGTGARVLAIAAALKKGEVVGVDADAERIALARAKAVTAQVDKAAFDMHEATSLPFEDDSFDAVSADASLEPPSSLAAIVAEAVRVARPGAPVSFTVTLRGSFDEFFSVFWEALDGIGLATESLSQLEALIGARPTLQDAMDAARAAGVDDPKSHRRKEEFRFDTGADFLASPLVADLFLDEWLSIVPEDRLDDVRASIVETIDRARDGYYFDVSAKTLLVVGHKAE